jgi:uncharacterized Fe-S cluster-containing radical SAM superfamily protein
MAAYFEHRRARKEICWPNVVTLHLTDRCNHSCPWCFFDRAAQDANMPSMIDVMSFLIAKGAAEVVVSGGGEPLLHRDISLLLQALQTNQQLHRRLYTNGSLIRRHKKDIADAFDYVRVSLDAGSPRLYATLHGCSESMFRRILDDLEDLASLNGNLVVGVSAVISDVNANTVDDLLRECHDRGIRQIFIKPLVVGKGRSFPDGFLSSLPRSIDADIRPAPRLSQQPTIPANIASLNIVLSADNSIYPCCHLRGDTYRICDTDVDKLKHAYASDRHSQILRQYAAVPHPCRAHDLWTAFGEDGDARNVYERVQ